MFSLYQSQWQDWCLISFYLFFFFCSSLLFFFRFFYLLFLRRQARLKKKKVKCNETFCNNFPWNEQKFNPQHCLDFVLCLVSWKSFELGGFEQNRKKKTITVQHSQRLHIEARIFVETSIFQVARWWWMVCMKLFTYILKWFFSALTQFFFSASQSFFISLVD